MSQGSKIFLPNRSLGYVSNHIPLKVRYIKRRKENLIITCVGKSFHTYGVSHFGLLSVGPLHPEDITCMTADAYHVYTSCQNIIYAWRRGTELKHTYRGHKTAVHLMIPFGVHLIAVDENSCVKVWDIKGETVYLELTFSNNSFRISAILHPATYINKILFGSEQGKMQLWNINTAKHIYTFKGWKAQVTCLEQAPALDVVGIGLSSGKIMLHNLKYDETIMEFVQDWGLVTNISFRSDGTPLMSTGSMAGHIVFWNLEERRVASQLIYAHDNAVTGMVCLPSEPLIITSSPDNTLKLWIFDMADGGARLLRIREGHAATPTSIRFHGANGHNILSAAGDSSLRIFNTQTEIFNKSLGKASYNRKVSKKKRRSIQDPLRMPPIIQFTSETTREKEWDNIAAIHIGLPTVTTWSYDKLKMGEQKLIPQRFCKKNKSYDVEVVTTCLCLSHCGNFVIIGYSSGHVDRFNMQSGIWRDSYGNTLAHEFPVRGVTSDSLNQVVVTGGSNGEIKFWNFKNKGRKPLTVIKAEESINFFRSHRESSLLAISLEDFSILIIDIDTRTVVRKFTGHTAQITDATFSPDSRWLVTSAMDCTIRTWNVPSAQLIDQFRTDVACISLNMSPTGELLATAHVDYFGIFLWSNKTLYSNVTLKALSEKDEPVLVVLPECTNYSCKEVEEIEEDEEPHFISPDQISSELVTLSGLAGSRWQNLLNIDIIRRRNKPKAPAKTSKAAPFFLPTVPSLNFQFDLRDLDKSESKIIPLIPEVSLNLSAFGKILNESITTNDFTFVIEKLVTMGPSLTEFELKSLSPEGGGSVVIMLQFLKCIEFMLKSNRDFEIAQALLGVFLKNHGTAIASEEHLRNYLPNIQSCHIVGWKKLQEKLFYNMCIVQSLKTL